jgi:hypothetical protein
MSSKLSTGQASPHPHVSIVSQPIYRIVLHNTKEDDCETTTSYTVPEKFDSVSKANAAIENEMIAWVDSRYDMCLRLLTDEVVEWVDEMGFDL